MLREGRFRPALPASGEGRMKIRNKLNGVQADVADVLAGVLVAGGGWETLEEPVKPPVKRAPRKAVKESVSDKE